MVGRILVAEDDDDTRRVVGSVLEGAGHAVTGVCDGRAAVEALARRAFDVLITDLQMPVLDGVGLLKHARAERPEMEVLILTAHASIRSAVECMRLGAYDYIQKPVDPDALRFAVARAVERRELERFRESVHARQAPEPVLTFGAPAMRPVMEAIERVAPTNASVLLLGESGVGKEVVARRLHQLSKRAAGPLIPVHCAAYAESLLESELFGHEKGAFTGAGHARAGRLELARGGTVFLDEIGELKPELQVKLLRVVQERTVERVGGSRAVDVDVRWIAATNADLPALIQDGLFREDLYHRLAVFPLSIPPLRERPEDILPLAEQLLERVAVELGRPPPRLSQEAQETLRAAPWRGNVRELRNALERASIMCSGSTIEVEHLRLETAGANGPAGAGPRDLNSMEREAIVAALAAHGGNRRKAAEQLGIALRTLYNKLTRYGLR